MAFRKSVAAGEENVCIWNLTESLVGSFGPEGSQNRCEISPFVIVPRGFQELKLKSFNSFVIFLSLLVLLGVFFNDIFFFFSSDPFSNA